jgi:hypothetical protein
MAPLMSPDYTLNDIDVVDLSTPASATGHASGVIPGSRGAADPVPESCAVILQYKIARRYRGGHPRGYWPLGDAAALSSLNTWSAPFQALCIGGWQTFQTHIIADYAVDAGDVARQVNVSAFHGFSNVLFPSGRMHVRATPRPVPLVDDVVAIGVNPKIGTQRRRLLQSG